MKKLTFTLIAIVFISVILSSCMTQKTTHTKMGDNHIYSKYEKVSVYDNESGSELGYIQVNDVYILVDEPFEMYEYVTVTNDDGESNTVKEWTEYEVLVQVNYEEFHIDSSVKSKFFIEDCFGKAGQSDITIDYEIIQTDDKLAVVALKNKGDYINFEYYYQRSNYEPTAKIRAEYNESTQSRKPINTPDEITSTQTPIDRRPDHTACRILIFFFAVNTAGFFIAFIVMLNVNRNLRQRLKFR